MIKTLLKELIEANTVNEQSPVDPVDGVFRDTASTEDFTIDSVFGEGLLLIGFE